MRPLLHKTLRTGLSVPGVCLRWARRYESLASVRAESSVRVLLIASHWLGDTLWAAQVVPALRDLWPEGRLACVTKPLCAPLWRGALAVDQVVESTAVVSDRRREATGWSALRRLSGLLGDGAWDVVVDLTGNRYSALLSHWIGARHSVGFDGGECAALYATRVAAAERPGRHLSERPFRVIEPLVGAFKYPPVMKAPCPQDSYETVSGRYGLGPGRPVAVVAPGAGWPEKEWGDEHFSRLAHRLAASGHDIVLMDSPARRDRLAKIAQAVGGESRIVVVAEPDINAALSLLSGCALFVGNDSGLGHVAAAMGTPTCVLFTGETEPAICGPLGPHVHVLPAGEAEQVYDELAALLAPGPGVARAG